MIFSIASRTAAGEPGIVKSTLRPRRSSAASTDVSAGDWIERRSWEEYVAAYEDVFRLCSTPEAPWYIVPADKKWFRNLAVAEAVVEALRPHREGWLAALRERGERELAAIQVARRERPQRST